MTVARVRIGWASFVGAVVLWGFGTGSAAAQVEGVNSANVEFKTLYNFTGLDDGATPAELLQANNGDLFGTTQSSASAGGTIFKMTPTGTLTTVYTFCTLGCPGGGYGYSSSLLQVTNGNLYGVTGTGGELNCAPAGCGTILQMSPGGAFSTLYSFCSQFGPLGCPDGNLPTSLVQGANGELYGATDFGGPAFNGTLFKITPSGTLTTLYSFCSQPQCLDGEVPGGLMQASNGSLYGITAWGGINDPACQYGQCGTVFKITPAGNFTTLYRFCAQASCSDGYNPTALVQAAKGNIFGITSYGGIASSSCVYGSCGTIFKLTPDGALTTVYTFCSQANCADGSLPSGLMQAASGELYGTTLYGGTYGAGTIFRISRNGTLATLYNFCVAGCVTGFSPAAGLTQATNGIFYGTTSAGGSSSYGTVFALSTGEPPFVETRPAIGIVGEVVTILGYGLKGATSVTFNGMPATILYDAATVIYAKVPAGATTGKVQVVTPSGTLTSNVAFEVAP